MTTRRRQNMPAKRVTKSDLAEMESFKSIVCDFYGLNAAQLIGARGPAVVSWARAVAMFLIHDGLNLPITVIGPAFGGRHSTTVVHACRTVPDICSVYPQRKSEIAKLILLLTTFHAQGTAHVNSTRSPAPVARHGRAVVVSPTDHQITR